MERRMVEIHLWMMELLEWMMDEVMMEHYK